MKNLLFSVITSWTLYFSCLVWAAPEVLSGGPYSHAADWWSLGILLFALVTGKVRSHKLYIYLFQMGIFFIVSSLHLSVSSTRRARSHHHVEQGQKLSLCRPQVLQLRSDLTADWGLGPPPEYPSLLYVIFKANICSISSLLVQLLCKSPAQRLRNLECFQMQPLFRGISFDPFILQKTPADIILQLRAHPDWTSKARRGLSSDDLNDFDCEVSPTLAKMDLSLDAYWKWQFSDKCMR